jgi:histone acetyltransferase (RNA polymerase elongator complex component)
MSTMEPDDYAMELGPMGPIGEGAALMLRVNRNCPWNRCLFCPVYKPSHFSARSVEEVKRDMEAARRVGDLLEGTSWDMGLNGYIQHEVIEASLKKYPELYGKYPSAVTEKQWSALRCLSNVANWYIHGARRVFLQDANALFMKPGELIEVLRYLKKTFPSVDTITCYARARTCARRTPEELTELPDAGLSWCFVGVESGCDEVLEFMKKGVTREEHISGGRKLVAAGIQMAAFVMPGLGGRDTDLSRRHTRDTISVLNEIQPTEVRVRSLAVLESAPLYGKCEAREFFHPGEDQMVEELGEMIEGIDFDCAFETVQMTNAFTFRGRLPGQKRAFLDALESYRALPPVKRARYLLNRYLCGGYLEFVQKWGRLDPALQEKVEEAESSIAEEASDALKKVETALFTLKSKGIP